MTNIFEYKPQLKYILEDINTIDNITDEQIKYEERYILNRPSVALEIIDDNLTRIRSIKSKLELALKDKEIRIDSNIVDDFINNILSSITDGEKLLEQNIITFNLYKECINNPLLFNIADEWERYHIDIDGSLEAEIYPYVLELEEDTVAVKQILDLTLLSDKNKTLDEIKKEELLSIEQLIKLKDSVKQARRNNVEPEEVIKLVKLKEESEMKLNLSSNLSEIIIDFARSTSNILDVLETSIDEDINKQKQELYKKQSSALKNILQSKSEFLIYHNFKSKRDYFYSKKQNTDSRLNREIKKSIYNSVVVDSKVYSDIVIPSLNTIDYKDFNDLEASAVLNAIDSIEELVQQKDNSLMELKNILESTKMNISSDIALIIDKHGQRLLYKSLKQ